MFRLIIGLLFLSSCSLGVVKTGGDKPYVYDVHSDYTSDELKVLAPGIVTTFRRDPQQGKLDELFSKKQAPLKRVGILIFESIIQPTLSGLSGQDKIYLSEQGKQLLTEKLLSVWEQSFPILGTEIVYVPTSKIKKSEAFRKYGQEVTNVINAKRTSLAPDDIFFLEPGKNTTVATILNPRRMQDFSLAMVPATELMSGPKFSEHQKHAINEITKELKLDAVIIVMSKVKWTAAHTDKHSQEVFPEVATIALEVSTLVSFSEYHARLRPLGMVRDVPYVTLAYRTYESELKVPVLISVSPEEQTFSHIENELLVPVLKTYKDLTQMVQFQLIDDLKKTHK